MARLISLSILLATTVYLTGCSSLNAPINQWNPLEKFNAESEKEKLTPLRMAIMWKDSVIHGVGTTPTVGFGGRVYFYNMDDETVEADGELTIYGYEDHNKTSVADKKFIIRQEELQDHYDDGGLGPSYGVWVPWEKLGGNRKSISLLPVFKTTDGRIIRGHQALVVLPGKAPQKEQLAKTEIFPYPSQTSTTTRQATYDGTGDSQVVLAGGEATPNTTTNPSTRIKTTTIAVPREMGRRLSQLPAPVRNKPAIQPEELEAIVQQFQARNLPGPRNARSAHGSNTDETAASKYQAPAAKTPSQRPIFGQPGSFQ
ncbi:MAG: hypothetical protein MK108_12510 [Mariniblastus sp.]|nr:hypothetical protein [Mariniblastus sp.]